MEFYMSIWLGYGSQLFGKHQFKYSYENILQMWLTFNSNI